jgi:hypothetical protein
LGGRRDLVRRTGRRGSGGDRGGSAHVTEPYPRKGSALVNIDAVAQSALSSHTL